MKHSPDGESDASVPVAGTAGSDSVGFAQIRAEAPTIPPTIRRSKCAHCGRFAPNSDRPCRHCTPERLTTDERDMIGHGWDA